MKLSQISSLYLKSLAALAICLPITVHAQTLVSSGQLPATTYTNGSYYNRGPVAINPTTTIAPATGQKVEIYALNPGVGCNIFALAPSASQNYILTQVPRTAMDNVPSGSLNTCDVMSMIQYFDGLGRPLQSVQVRGNKDGTRDVVQPIAYDAFGREPVKYLPYAASTADGSYIPSAIADQSAFYHPSGTPYNTKQLNTIGVAHITAPYSVTVFEPSPLNRVLEQGAPGEPWQPAGTATSTETPGHTVRTDYLTNDQSSTFDATRKAGSRIAALYTVGYDASGIPKLQRKDNNEIYGSGQLYVTVSRDENWVASDEAIGTTEEYKDKEGRVVLKRTYNLAGSTTQMLSTYYVYDDLGNLSFVLPPGVNPDATTGISDADGPVAKATLNSLCYQYQYDERNRLVWKKLPGKGEERMVYNKLDQLVMAQDKVQQNKKEWTLTKYDGLGRIILTGLWTDPNATAKTPAQLQADIYAGDQWDKRDETNNTTSYSQGYVISSYPSANYKSLTVNYYDSYENIPGLPATYSKAANYSAMTRGLLTATKTAVLNTLINASPDMLWSVPYYDDKGRVVASYNQHYLGGSIKENNYDLVTSSYDFTGAVIASNREHHTSGTNGSNQLALTIANSYGYDHMGRKIDAFQQTGSGAKVLLSRLGYNDIGQLWTKGLHSENNGTSFLQTVNYSYNERGWMGGSASNKFTMSLAYNSGTNAQYNGNISSQGYTNNGSTNTFTYSYDRLNRLTRGEATGMSEVLSYDVMGNIKTLSRDGTSRSYSYYSNEQSNQLKSVSNLTAADYEYDANGNATRDGRLNKAITYNLLNLPQSVSGGPSYTYLASGQKLRKVSGNTATDYISGIQYTTSGSGAPAVDFVQTEEGLAKNSGGSYSYNYDLKDHLGNSRTTLYRNPSNGNTEVLQQDDYYPFGLRKAAIAGTNKYLYNGKELQDELGQYDYGARFYDPIVGRFHTIDRYAEKYYKLNIYNYGGNNPITTIDINGDSLRTTGTASASATMRDIAETGMGGNVTMSQNKSGTWNISTPTDEQIMNMTPEQAEMYKTVHQIVNDPKTVSFGLLDGNDALSQKVIIGDHGVVSANPGAVMPGVHLMDVGDMNALGSAGLVTAQSTMAHELTEGYAIQTTSLGVNKAHGLGIVAEGRVSGAMSFGGSISGNTLSVQVSVGGVMKTVTINTNNNNFKAKDVQGNQR